jgi:hypothetical protein
MKTTMLVLGLLVATPALADQGLSLMLGQLPSTAPSSTRSIALSESLVLESKAQQQYASGRKASATRGRDPGGPGGFLAAQIRLVI